jgi:DNA-binding NtrC family response regulator
VSGLEISVAALQSRDGVRRAQSRCGREALALLDKDGPIDVLFTDIGLKGDIHAGLELAKEAREQRPNIKVLYTTGQGVTDGMRALFADGLAFPQ